MNINDKLQPIRKGLLELAVLKIISSHRVYAADILKKLAVTEFASQEGTLYPLLSRLRREGAVAYEWVESESGPPRKYYQLTDSGRTQLFRLEDYVRTLTTTLENIGDKS